MTTNHNFWPLFPLGKEEVGTVVDWQTICWGISACRPPCRRNTIYFPLKVSFNIKRFFCCASSSRLYPRRPSENEKGGGDLPRQMSVLRFQLFKLICPPVPETSCPRSWEVKLPAAITQKSIGTYLSNSVPPSLVIINFQNSISHIKYDIDDNVNAFGFEKNNQQPPEQVLGACDTRVETRLASDPACRSLLLPELVTKITCASLPSDRAACRQQQLCSVSVSWGGGQVTSYRTISPHGQRTVTEGCFELYFSFLLFALISKLALYPPCIPKRTIDQGK